jgi:RNase adaptor protein for sRNA GlmZ degradation
MDHHTGPAKRRVLITSYGTLHGPAPEPLLHGATPVQIDVTTALRNPHEDPGMRYRTGLDTDVYEHVLATPGATQIIDAALAEILERFEDGQEVVEVHAYCRGGRHRSVSLARALDAALTERGIETHTVHRDVDKPVVQPVPVTAGKEA